MLDVNLLSKDLRAKKQREIKRIKASASKHPDLARGEKINKRILSVNFLRRFFSAKHPVEEAAKVSPAVLQMPKETPPPAPPQTPPSPLRPVPIPEVMKRVQPKVAPVRIEKAADGIILPEISDIIQKQTALPAKLQAISQSEPKPETPEHETPKVAPPPSMVSKTAIEVEVLRKQESKPAPIAKVEIGIAKEAEIAVMPRKEKAQPRPSLLVTAIAGILAVIFAGSFIAGSFLVLNRWVIALEKVRISYEDRTQSVEKIIKKVDQYTQEAVRRSRKTQILYEIFKTESKGEN